jgi:hypothetical protein
MEDRDFTEVDLREMLERVHSYRAHAVVGRWGMVTRHRQELWEVIVGPAPASALLVVIIAYPVEK